MPWLPFPSPLCIWHCHMIFATFHVSLWSGILTYGEWQLCSLRCTVFLKSPGRQTDTVESWMGWCSGTLCWLSGRVCSSLDLYFLVWILESPLFQIKVVTMSFLNERGPVRCRYQHLRTYLSLIYHGLVNNLYFYDAYSAAVNNLPQSLMLINSPYLWGPTSARKCKADLDWISASNIYRLISPFLDLIFVPLAQIPESISCVDYLYIYKSLSTH